MSEKKKLMFYSIMSSGHLNVCASLAKVLLDNHPDFEVWFIADSVWSAKLKAIDSRFKIALVELKEDYNAKLAGMVQKLEAVLKMDQVIDKLLVTWRMFVEDPILFEIDEPAERLIKEIKPDYLACDQVWHLPAMVNSGVPYGFICSASPLMINLEGFPRMGSDCRMDDPEYMARFNEQFDPHWNEMKNQLLELLKSRGAKIYDHQQIPIEQARSDHLSLYSYPREIDYYSEELKTKYKLLQIDSPLSASRVPKPFELPEEFAKLPEKTIVYVSLGSMFSAYVHLIQRLVDMLETMPYKYIISKGAFGDQLKFPSAKFIGENFVDQLAVLQVSHAIISHGGNNTLGECFYFGVPAVIMPVLGDQISNAARLEETKFGFRLDLMKCTEQELADCLAKLTGDAELRLKWKKASERIQKEQRIVGAVNELADYIRKL